MYNVSRVVAIKTQEKSRRTSQRESNCVQLSAECVWDEELKALCNVVLLCKSIKAIEGSRKMCFTLFSLCSFNDSRAASEGIENL
jgi:hypothetical protein